MFGGCNKMSTQVNTSGSDNNSGNNSGNSAAESETDADAVNGEPIEVDFSQTSSDMFTDRDYEIGYDENDSILIQLNGDSASASSDSVHISGTTITITENATHIISGTLNDGMIIVNAPDTAKLQLVLNGVNINSSTSAPLYILEADKVFVTLADGSENVLSNGGSFTPIDENNIDSAIFSKQDITLNGSGTLTVNSPAGHGIVSKDDLVLTSGTYIVNAASHGMDANDSVRIANADISIYAGKDGIHVENSDDASLGFVYIGSGDMKIEAEGDGISAGSYMQIENGAIDILAGGGYVNGTSQSSSSWGNFKGGRGHSSDFPSPFGSSAASADTASSDESSTSMKGIKSVGSMLISNGTITIDSADDAIHSDTSITVNGGTFEIASGDDAFHAEETLAISAGNMNITQSYEGLEALNVAVSGGNIKLTASDDGLNAAGGTDSSGTTGGRDGMFGGGRGGMGGMGGMSSSNGTIVISGGTLYVNSSGDGLDANGTLTITGGYTTVVGPTQGDTSTLDYDKSGVITGGTFIGTGASGMAQSFSDSEQGVVAINAGNRAAGTNITLQDKDGNTLISYAPELSFAVVIISSPDIVSGETYTVTIGAETGEFEAK